MNVVVFALNGCPVSALGAYGNEWIATPTLDRLAADGVVFDRHISDCPDPAIARRTWRAGSGGVDPLANLADRGVRTVLVRASRPENDGPSEFYAGWHDLFDARPDPADKSPVNALLRLLPTIADRLAGTTDWLLWLELDPFVPPWDVPQDVFEVYVEELLDDEENKSESDDDEDEDDETEDDAITPDDSSEVDEDEDDDEEEVDAVPILEPVRPWTDPPTGWFDTDDLASWELLHRSFAAAMTTFDADLARLFAAFATHGWNPTSLLTATHGLPLGEHGLVGRHRPWLHDEFVHLPLIVRFADSQHAGRRVTGFTQPGDLFPTICSWFGVQTSPGLGFDLNPLLSGRVDSVRDFATSRCTIDKTSETAIRTDDWVYLLPADVPLTDDPRSPMLFAQPDDVNEVNNVVFVHPEVVEELDRKLKA